VICSGGSFSRHRSVPSISVSRLLRCGLILDLPRN
jgi:hypothetical protein